MLHKEDTRFFVDSMLGNIAKKLRLLGYDSKYFADIDDMSLISIAKLEERIIISKDHDLVRKAEKLGMRPIFITKSNEIEQFNEIINHINLDIFKVSGNTARCPKCNSTTKQIDKRHIRDTVPQKVYQTNENFWMCNSCNQIYWEGTHIGNLQKFLRRINGRP